MSLEDFKRTIERSLGENPSFSQLLMMFPSEMHDDLDDKTAHLSESDAIEYLKERLARRREVQAEFTPDMIPEGIEISNEIPRAFIESIDQAEAAVEKTFIGAGQNGKFLRSVRDPQTGHKILFNEQAEKTGANIIREVILQYECERLLRGKKNVAQIPTVWRYVRTKDIQSMKMDLIEGESLEQLIARKGNFPANFDLDSFFEKLANAISILNAAGYHHRDLTNKLGNVIVDKEGEPWIIDFGSAIKASPDQDDPNRYQTRPGAPYTLGTDRGAVVGLKKRVAEYLNKQGRS